MLKVGDKLICIKGYNSSNILIMNIGEIYVVNYVSDRYFMVFGDHLFNNACYGKLLIKLSDLRKKKLERLSNV